MGNFARVLYLNKFFVDTDFFYPINPGNAAGTRTPPFLVFQGKRFPNQIKAILPPKWHADISESGWMNSDIFFKYISTVFHPWLLEIGIEPTIILFVDGHVSHRSLQLSEFCLDKKIVLISFLPNTTHIFQPMDVVVYGPTKRKWSSNLHTFRNSHPDTDRMPKSIFCELLHTCIEEVCTPDLIKAAFVKTGLYPFDAENFDYSKLTTEQDTSDEMNQPIVPNNCFEISKI